MKEAETIRGYHLKGKKGLNHWDALLEEWLLAHERYCRIMKDYDACSLVQRNTQCKHLVRCCLAVWKNCLARIQDREKSSRRGTLGR